MVVVLTMLLAGTRLEAQRYAWTAFAGQAGSPGSADGSGSSARFYNPIGVAVDSVGTVYVADSGNYTVRMITAAGAVTTLAGSVGNPGAGDGSGTEARFRWPAGVAAGSIGEVFVADADLRTIRKVTAAGVVTTFAGNTGNIGSADGDGSFARFNNPFGVAVGSAGLVYVADTYNRTIRRITAAGSVTTLAGLAGNIGNSDGVGSVARFFDPLGVAVDSTGTIYVADSYNHTIRRVSAGGGVTTLAGLPGSAGSSDGSGGTARFNLPFGIAADDAGNQYVSDSRNATIRKITAAGAVTTIGGTAGRGGAVDGVGAAARFLHPYGIAVDRAGIVYVADAGNHRIVRGVPFYPPTVTDVTAATPDGTWGLGAVIAITITFSTPVKVTGKPQLRLEMSPSDAVAEYAYGSGTATLTFLYTVAAEQTSPHLDYVNSNSLTLHGGTIKDGGGNAAVLALPVPGAPHSLGANKALAIDGVAPTLTLTSTAPDPTNLAAIPVLATFSEPVIGFEASDLTLTNASATDFLGSGASYSFTVTPSGQGPLAVRVAAGVCTSLAGTPNRAAAPLSRTYDSIPPVIVDVSSPAPDGIYGPGAVITVTVAFSESVIVDGAPQLSLETGDTDALLSCGGGSGTATLGFTYNVMAGQESADLDCSGTAALAAHEGAIQDAAGNPAVLALPVPGTPHSLGANKALVVAAAGAPNGPFLAQVDAAGVAAGRGLWDLTGTYATTVHGVALALDLVHDPHGTLTGTATLSTGPGKAAAAALVLPARGVVRGTQGTVLLTLALKGANAERTLAAALRLRLALDAASRQLSGEIRGTLDQVGVHAVVADPVTLAVPPPMDGAWSLQFRLRQGGRGCGGTAVLTLANGVEHSLAVRGKLTGATAVMSLVAAPADPAAAGIACSTAIGILGGPVTRLAVFSGRAYGQALSW